MKPDIAHSNVSAVTGAFGFSGKYIARRLLERGERVLTLTNHPDPRSSLYGVVDVCSLDFRNPEQLAHNLRNVTVLYNTYWVRFAHKTTTHERAVENTVTLLRAAEKAGVRRIVHVSITNPSPDSPLPYFKGKAEVENAIRQSRLSHAILRPAVLFGEEDILINNIAWLLRRFPIFAVPGKGDYGLQPVFVEDLADLAVEAGQGSENLEIDTIGPETYAYADLVRLIRATIGARSLIVRLPPSLVLVASRLLGLMVRDVVLTPDEITGLMAGLLVSRQAPTGKTSLRQWLEAHAGSVGEKYASELDRHFR